MTRHLLLPCALATLLVVGCGGDSTAPAAEDAAARADATTADVAPTADNAADATAPDAPSADAASGLGPEPPASYENSCGAEGACPDGRTCVDGLCAKTPADEVTLTSPADDRPSSVTPDLSCVGEPVPSPEGPATVRMWGLVDRFGGGKRTIGVEVAVFRAEDFQPWECTDDDADDRRDCIEAHATPVGTAVSIDPDDWAPNAELVKTVEEIRCQDHLDCPRGYECLDPNGIFECVKQFGIYTIDGVPTNTPLVVRSRPTNEFLSMRAAYIHHAVLLADRAAADHEQAEAIRFDPTIVSESQWVQVPNTFGSSIRIQEGHTALGGRIRDCHGGARDPDASFYLTHAIVASGRTPTKIGYFNDKEDDALPLVDRTSTNLLGRFALIDVPGGWNKVVAAARSGGEVRSLGVHELYLVPDALNVLSFPGLVSHARN